MGKDWNTTKFLQALHSNVDEGQIANVLEPPTEEAEANSAHDDRLSTIEEVSQETDSSLSAMMNEFAQQHMPPVCDEEWWSLLSPEVKLGCYNASMLPLELEDAVPLWNVVYGLGPESDSGAIDALPDIRSLHTCRKRIYWNTTNKATPILRCGALVSKLFDEPAPGAGQDRVLRSYLAGNCRTSVVERDDDLLAKEDMNKYPKDVASATLEELQTWIDHDCFRRKPRRGAPNILDARWVAKWKFRKAKDGASKMVRTIRMILTLRGFKDGDAEDLTTCVGTPSRLSQRLVVSEAAVQGWPLATVDVKKAFLKGISYDELEQTTQEPKRGVNFDLPRTQSPCCASARGMKSLTPRQRYCTWFGRAPDARTHPGALLSN